MNKGKLSKELEYFNSRKEEFLKFYKDKYVLIKGAELIGAFDSIEDAFQVSIEKFGGDTPVLIKKVLREDNPEEIPALTVGIINSLI